MFKIPVVAHDQIGLATFLRKTPLTRFASPQFTFRPTPMFTYAGQPNFVRRIDEDNQIALVAPTCFQKDGGIQKDGVPVLRLRRCDALDDPTADFGMNDVFQIATRFEVARLRSKHFPSQRGTNNIPVGSKDGVTESLTQGGFHFRALQCLVPQRIRIEKRNSSPFRNPIGNRTFSRPDSSHDSNDGNPTRRRESCCGGNRSHMSLAFW